MKKENDFGRDSIPLLVLKISIPFMFAQFVNVLYSIVDRIYIGNIPVIGADSFARRRCNERKTPLFRHFWKHINFKIRTILPLFVSFCLCEHDFFN